MLDALTRHATDRIVMRAATLANVPPSPPDECATTETWLQDGRRFTRQRVRIGTRTLTAQTRQDPDVNTV